MHTMHTLSSQPIQKPGKYDFDSFTNVIHSVILRHQSVKSVLEQFEALL